MIESGLPGVGTWREQSPDRLLGPLRHGAYSARPSSALAKFHAPEIVFGPGALAELGHCAGRLGARAAVPGHRPGADRGRLGG